MPRTVIATAICQICGKEFIPAPLHIYKYKHKRVCTYHCALEGERRSNQKGGKLYVRNAVKN